MRLGLPGNAVKGPGQRLLAAAVARAPWLASLQNLLRPGRARGRGAFSSDGDLGGRLSRLIGRLRGTIQAGRRRLRSAESALRVAMDPPVAEMLLDGSLRHHQERDITVLCCDIEGPAVHPERDAPERVVEQLNRFFSAADLILRRYRGHLDRFAGDGFVAEFGAPYATRQHAVLAVLAALRIQERMAALDLPWKLRIGIATGPCIMGLVGSDRRKNYTAIGDPVNLVSEIRSLCPPWSVCVDSRTYDAVRHWTKSRRIRQGLDPREARDLERRVEELAASAKRSASPDDCIQVAQAWARLGEPESVLEWFHMALDIAPERREEIERALGPALRVGEERASLTVKGRRHRVSVYELTGFMDPLEDPSRVPVDAAAAFGELESRMRLPLEAMEVVEGLEGAIGHARATAAISAALAERLDLDEAAARDVFLAAYLHDIGKLALPIRLLGCDERLEYLPEADRALLRTHPEKGRQALDGLRLRVSDRVLQAVTQHHELFDGSGYPRGLKGEEICLGARIIQVAEMYEALTAWRPYREAFERGSAVALLRGALSDGKIDPRVGRAFLRLVETM